MVNVGSSYNLGATSNWSTSDSFVATVSNSGLVTGKHVGTCTVSSNAGSCRITVKATINLYRDPITQWGCSKQTIINQWGNDYSETSSALGYKGDDFSYVYMFDNNGLLNSVAILFTPSLTSQVVNHLKQRYDYTYDNGEYVFTNHKTTGVVVKKYNSNYWVAMYMKYNP